MSRLAVMGRRQVWPPPSFPVVLNGYMSVKARVTSTGEGKLTKHTVGIDISKDHLDACWLPAGEARRFSNNRAGFRALAAWIDPRVERVGYEPTGPWHRGFEEAFLEAGVPLYRINPYQLRCFARSIGRRAKTDSIDAKVAAQMVRAVAGLRPLRKESKPRRELVDLQSARDALVRDRTALLNRGRHVRHSLIKRLNRDRLRQIERQIGLLDAEMKKLVSEDADLARRAEILTSIPGISDITAAGLLVHMPELGTLTSKTAGSLAGLAPVTRESGAWRGTSWIQGGRRRLRRLLYMPALVATRHHPELRRKYLELQARGKPKKVALTAVMRKLVVLSNVLIQEDRLWEPREVASPA